MVSPRVAVITTERTLYVEKPVATLGVEPTPERRCAMSDYDNKYLAGHFAQSGLPLPGGSSSWSDEAQSRYRYEADQRAAREQADRNAENARRAEEQTRKSYENQNAAIKNFITNCAPTYESPRTSYATSGSPFFGIPSPQEEPDAFGRFFRGLRKFLARVAVVGLGLFVLLVAWGTYLEHHPDPPRLDGDTTDLRAQWDKQGWYVSPSAPAKFHTPPPKVVNPAALPPLPRVPVAAPARRVIANPPPSYI